MSRYYIASFFLFLGIVLTLIILFIIGKLWSKFLKYLIRKWQEKHPSSHE